MQAIINTFIDIVMCKFLHS